MTLPNDTGQGARYSDLEGKVAVVTGGSKGIGAATSRMLASNGVKVVVSGRDADSLRTVVEAIRSAGGEAVGIAADCTIPDDLERLSSEVEKAFGAVDILIAFAGGFAAMTPIWEITQEEWRAVLDTNLTTTFLTLRTFLPGMVQRKGGAVVTMASNAGRLLDITLTASYAAAKAGIVQLTRHAALELGPHNVRINCVAPATTLTARVERLMSPDRLDSIARMSPLGRMGTPEDTAAAAVFLASDAASWITGVTVDISGGRVML